MQLQKNVLKTRQLTLEKKRVEVIDLKGIMCLLISMSSGFEKPFDKLPIPTLEDTVKNIVTKSTELLSEITDEISPHIINIHHKNYRLGLAFMRVESGILDEWSLRIKTIIASIEFLQENERSLKSSESLATLTTPKAVLESLLRTIEKVLAGNAAVDDGTFIITLDDSTVPPL